MNLLGSLKYLVALDEHRHFGRAAQACHITQPALSNALRAMEKEFGCAIVLRGRAYVGLTPEGQRVLASARRMLHEHELLRQDLDSGVDDPRGALKIGCIPTAMPIAARFAARLQARHPGITPAVLSLSSPEIEAGLENLSLDLGLGYTDRLSALGLRLRVVPQYTEHYFLVRRSDAPQCGADAIRTGHDLGRSRAPAAVPADAGHAQPHAGRRRLCRRGRGGAAGDGNQFDHHAGAERGQWRRLQRHAGRAGGGVSQSGALEALPLMRPEMRTPVGFMVQASDQPSRTLAAALTLAQDATWLGQVAANSGALG